MSSGERLGEPELTSGVDIEAVARFAEMDGGSLRRLFHDAERDYARASGDTAACYAGTWCAKEAVVKALWRTIHLDPRRVLITRDAEGCPLATISDWDAEAHGVRVTVSIAHSGGMAIASAVAWTWR